MRQMFSLTLLYLLLVHVGMLTAEALEEPLAVSREKIVIGILHDPPYTFKNAQGQWAGLNVDLWHDVARDLNLDFTLKEMSLEGILAALRQGEIDLTIAALFITAGREQQFDLTTPFGSTRLAVATLYGANDHPWLAALKIFFSWGTLKIVIFLAAVLMILGFLFWWIERKSNPEHFGPGVLKGIGAGIYWAGSTLASGVCFGISLKSITGRVLGIIWMMICALALSAFIASLSSSLTTQHLEEKSFHSENLRDMHLGTGAGTVMAQMIEKMGGRGTFFREEEDALKALIEKRIDGFFYDEVTLHYYAEKEYQGRITVNPTNMKELTVAFGMPMGSPLRKPINVAMLKVLEGPGWESLLSRYGLDKNFEAKPLVLGRQKKRRGLRND